jgi:hypothetical protein
MSRAGQVDLARGDAIEEHGEAPSEPGRVGAAQRGVLAHPKLVDAVGVEARARARAVKASGFDLGQVSQEAGEHLIGAAHHPAGAGEQFVILQPGQAEVGRRSEQSEVVHPSTLHPGFSTSAVDPGGAFSECDESFCAL